MSDNLGNVRYQNAVAGTDGNKYYISMVDNNAVWHLFTFDTRHGIWLHEDNMHIADFAFLDGLLYYLDLGANAIGIANLPAATESISWEAELVEFNESALNKKDYSRLYVRAELGDGAVLKIEAAVDGGLYRQVYLTHNTRRRTLTVPLSPYRCDELKIRLSGDGPCTIKAIEREFAVGSGL
jgi:hypothetical protein